MYEDKCVELADWIADVIDDDKSKTFEVLDQYETDYSMYDNWRAKLIIKHSDGSFYEAIINPVNDWYDSGFGDDKKCECGHEYYRHFDSYSHMMESVGCKYCQCYTFQEKK